MDCTAYDDLCHLQHDYAAYVAELRQDEEIDRNTFRLGIFNGRAYAYTEFDGRTTIIVADVNPDGSERFDKIGKFQLPEAIPPDYLVEEMGAVSAGTSGGAKSEANSPDINADAPDPDRD